MKSYYLFDTERQECCWYSNEKVRGGKGGESWCPPLVAGPGPASGGPSSCFLRGSDGTTLSTLPVVDTAVVLCLDQMGPHFPPCQWWTQQLCYAWTRWDHTFHPASGGHSSCVMRGPDGTTLSTLPVVGTAVVLCGSDGTTLSILPVVGTAVVLCGSDGITPFILPAVVLCGSDWTTLSILPVGGTAVVFCVVQMGPHFPSCQ